MKKVIFVVSLLLVTMYSHSQEVIHLYDNDSIPNSKPAKDEEISEIQPDSHILIISNVSHPTLTIYLPAPEKATGTAVIICPGGGYAVLAASHEGSDVARKFNEMGIAAFVLKYRIPNDLTMVQKEIGPLQDAQRAILLVREHAAEWAIDPKKIGIMGFSAGGHLASTAATHFSKALIANPKNISLRPDFQILIYPVISFSDSIGHIGSRDNLLGKNPGADRIRYYSNELQIRKNSPEAFLVHAKDDNVVPVQNSLDYYEDLRKNKVEAGIYLYEKGGHGFGMNNPTSDIKWMPLVQEWLRKNGLIK